eukprot:CAMPEP_0177744882 /NCGR_PEP_ID=MMETSP0484_2-20121128/30002_1 /TAXON_ID=354590 /ORGANISM="Rhodomonas lens, Strain RHODO" /LENGTH=675 /DNA_ID=CAMNT_0019259453 /DNA_START=74 /DNA_END=2098 /DNA_ORIENTATION=-
MPSPPVAFLSARLPMSALDGLALKANGKFLDRESSFVSRISRAEYGCAEHPMYGLWPQALSRRVPPLAPRRKLLMSAPDFIIQPKKAKVPITLLSGFLGSGKTTLLKEVLNNKGGLKVGVVVNDMAAVNIDSKLVKDSLRRQGKRSIGGELVDVSEVMELQNGCACCSSGDELLQSLLKLLAVGARRGEQFDRIVVELSGVAEPKSMRRQFGDMAMQDHPALDLAVLQNMVTVVDAANFLASYESADSIFERSELLDATTVAEESLGRRVVDLLTEQVEVADYVIINKQDTVPAEQMERLASIVAFLNPTAQRIPATYGKVDLGAVLGSERDTWVADLDDEDEFRLSVREARTEAVSPAGHAPGHESGHAHAHDCTDEGCTDASHGHEHGHAHSHETTCSDPECTDESHGHAHSHGRAASSSSSSSSNSPEAKFGISSFVYSRRRPMSGDRLRKVISELPVTSRSQEPTDQEVWEIPTGEEAQGEWAAKSPLKKVIRSKGFLWVEGKHRLALFWSQAGKFLDIKEFGLYWAATPLKYWPRDSEVLDQIVADFGSPGAAHAWGDRRLVGMDQDQIEQRLDTCLLTDAEMQRYAIAAEEEPDVASVDFTQQPRALFPSPQSRAGTSSRARGRRQGSRAKAEQDVGVRGQGHGSGLWEKMGCCAQRWQGLRGGAGVAV